MIASYMRGRRKCSAPAARNVTPRRRGIRMSMPRPLRRSAKRSPSRSAHAPAKPAARTERLLFDCEGEHVRAGALAAGVAGPAPEAPRRPADAERGGEAAAVGAGGHDLLA